MQFGMCYEEVNPKYIFLAKIWIVCFEFLCNNYVTSYQNNERLNLFSLAKRICVTESTLLLLFSATQIDDGVMVS